MHLTAILDVIAERETTAGQTAHRLREQITALTAELTRLDSELAGLNGEPTRRLAGGRSVRNPQPAHDIAGIQSGPGREPSLAILTGRRH